MPHRSAVRFVACFLAAMGILSQPAFAYEVPLSEHSVREAYFLGQRRDEKMSQFLKDYSKALPLPKTGPHVSEITLLTPYAQVVELSQENSAGYSAQQAARDYRKRGDTVRLRVRLLFTATYTSMDALDSARRARGPEDPEFGVNQFWRAFRFMLRQREESIPGAFLRDEPIYSASRSFPGLTGTNVYFDYLASKVKPEEVEVEVSTPGGQRVVAKFDLAKLR